MELTLHSGFGQKTPHVTTHSYLQDSTCRITRYTFTEHRGTTLDIIHFEHGRFPQLAEGEYVVDDDVVIA